MPPGTARYWSWFFAAPEVRAPLLGIFALGAEWLALTDPATESSAARLKLAWWQEEVQRLVAGSAVHPVSAYLARLPRAGGVDFSPLQAALDAAAALVGGAPLERGADLQPLSQALWGGPLTLASKLAREVADDSGLRRCTAALAAADYLSRAVRDYRREARAGRISFAVDELLSAGVDNADLAAAAPPAHLQVYLAWVRERASGCFDAAAHALPQPQRAADRHLLVLAALGRDQLLKQTPPPGRRRLRDMLLAWRAAQRAHRHWSYP